MADAEGRGALAHLGALHRIETEIAALAAAAHDVVFLGPMGLSPADYERDGITGYGHGDMFDGPYNLTQDAYDFGAIGDPLPGIFNG